ncbi:hypothetical protein KW795_00670 [Candidatus Microgenomates bacterium]|nr:hypothetical protein [Candidatus Microgenomates bacterium]
MGKIFGIGLPKTGQTSLAFAMTILGYKTHQYPYTPTQIAKSDFVLDLPVTIDYKNLDKQYPGSKFIMTIRDYDSWIDSMRNHYRRYPASKRYKQQLDFRQKFWGTIHFNKKLMTEKYYEHHKDVDKYFNKRKKDLLIINIIDGDKWKKLCNFLGKKIPKRKFPRENIGIYKDN